MQVLAFHKRLKLLMIKGGVRVQNKKNNSNTVESEIIIYQTEDGHTKIDVKFEDETVWLTQAQLCELYQTSKSNISEHIKHIFEEEELDEESVVRKFRTTAADGKNCYHSQPF